MAAWENIAVRMLLAGGMLLAVGAAYFVWLPLAKADAIIITKAMTASTIAEIFVENDHVRVELEIGVGDLEAFRNLLPNDFLTFSNSFNGSLNPPRCL